MSRQSKLRGSKGFGSSTSRPGGFGGFSTASTTLSYLTEPPNLSHISDANIVVSFKNLLKKDAITKAKALEDLVAFAQTQAPEDGGAEDAILDVWVQLYPRTSIDNSRRVRELSHTLQLELMKSARKRMEKRIPSIVGAWLAGSFDKDRGVARAATEGLTSFLNTEEKLTMLWKKCQSQILDYAIGALKETPDTLSDERSTNKEDAQAKYFRVVGGSSSLVLNLLKRGDVEKMGDELDEFLKIDAVWSMAAAEDSFVRKTLYQLLQTILDVLPNSVKSRLSQIGRILIADGLKSKQAGSAADLAKVLTNLTQHFPEVWGTKKHPLDRVRPFLERGSQGSSWVFWQELDKLLAVLPQDNLTVDIATEALKAVRAGISSREEPRGNSVSAWACYINTFDRFSGKLASQSEYTAKFNEDNIYPLTHQFLHPSSETSAWTLTEPKLFPKAWDIVMRQEDAKIRAPVEEQWGQLAENFISRMSKPLHDIQGDAQKSQEAVVSEGDRWFTLAGAVLGYRREEALSKGMQNFKSIITASSNKVLRGALEVLLKEDYKPFGAASVIQLSVAKCSDLYCDSGNDIISALLPIDQPARIKLALASPSTPYLLSCVNDLSSVLSQITTYQSIWQVLVDSALTDPTTGIPAMKQLLSNASATDLARQHVALQKSLLSACMACAKGILDDWELFEIVLAFNILTEDGMGVLAADLLQDLDDPKICSLALRALDLVLHKNPTMVSEDVGLYLQFVTKLLALTEISDETISSKASSLRQLLDQHLQGDQPVVEILRANLENAGPISLGVDTLIRHVTSVATNSVPREDLFPSSTVWMTELSAFLEAIPDPSLSLTSSLGGAYFVVKPVSSATTERRNPRRDRKGRSIPLRMALYMCKLLCSGLDLDSLPRTFRVELLYLLQIVVQLAADQVVLPRRDGLWANVDHDPEILGELEDFVSLGQSTLSRAFTESTTHPEGKLLIDELIEVLLRQSAAASSITLYSAKALANLLQDLVETRGFPFDAVKDKIAKLDVTKATPSTVCIVSAFLVGFGEALVQVPFTSNMFNRLISQIIGAFPGVDSTLHTMVLLNACLSTYEHVALPVDNRKLAMALKQLTSWTDTREEMGTSLAAETCKGLQRIAHHVQHIYGPYWEQAILFCLWLWKRAPKDPVSVRLPYLNASLRLMTTLENLPEPNDDLEEALHANANAISEGLLELLKMPREKITRPADIVDEVLCRRVGKIPVAHVKDPSELYSVIASDSLELQTAAFQLLHRVLPKVQEELSINTLLDKTDARLPDELLSLLLDAPTLEAYPEAQLVQFPTEIRSYLLAWHLIFDTIEASAHKLRSDYVEHLKSEKALGPLMEFTVDVLGHSAAHALNLDRENFTAEHIRTYDAKMAEMESPERNMHWLLIHLYYMVLKHLPGVFKAWFLENRSKQTRVALEAWTTKYFSPLVINETLDAVLEWHEQQEKPVDGEIELLVRVSRAAKEIIAGYQVDELEAAIALRIPASYPLENVTVEGVNRVAVSEKKWQAWIMSTQGTIVFSNGSIVEGLTTFRRNVNGALKGQEECAICYSIVASDKRMPDKKCGTCRNDFHRSCLYKWFTTSNQNTCPLCRNPIGFGVDTTRRHGEA